MTRFRALATLFAALTLLLAGLGTAGAARPDDIGSTPERPERATPDPEDRGGPDHPDCEDGADNDRDTFVDADDPECQQPGCLPSDETPSKCFEDGHTGRDDDGDDGDEEPEAGTCANGTDDDGDTLVDADDPDCQGEDCVQDDVNTCDETNDDGEEPGATNLCTGAAGDPGILTDDTLGQTLHDGGLSALSPLVEDPEADGPLSGAVYDGGTGTPLEPLTDEVACAVDLLIDSELGGDL